MFKLTTKGYMTQMDEDDYDQPQKHWKMDLKFLLKLRKILNEYHSQIPLVEVGRENVLNDVDNELKLDEKIEELRRRLGL